MSFSGPLARKCASLSYEKCMVRPTIIDLNPDELNCYPLITSLDKCNGSCNAVADLYEKICIPIDTRDVNVTVFHKITKINGAQKI